MSGTQAVATWLGRELSGGRYRVDAQLGEGGMGTVFRAWDKNLSTDVVIKVPHAAMLQDAEFAARFAREISSLVKLSHPHIVKISDVGDHDRLPFAVMQFLPGGSLEDRQKSDPAADVKPLPPESLKSWLVSIAEALDFVHSQGYIHRDVKPANILFDAHGHAYLSDFGIAKSAEGGPASTSKTLTGSGMVIGTPEYMAPELIMGQTCDGRVDQYALVVTVFEILAGRRPFEDATSTAVLVQHSTKEPPDLASLSPDVPAGLAAAIRKGLSKSPGDRFANCRKFADAVLAAVNSVSKSDEHKAKCPVCQKVLKLLDKLRGKEVPCPGCKTMLRVSDDLLQLTELKPDKNSGTGGGGTRVVSVRGAMPEVAQDSDGTFRLAGDRGEAAVATQSEPATSSVPVTQETMAIGQPSSRTKQTQSPASAKKGQTAKPKTSRIPKPQAAKQKPPTGNKKWLSIAAGGAAIVVLLGITIFVLTGRGTVKITVKGGDDSIQVKVDGDEITITGLDESLKLSAGEHGLTVTSPRFETVTKSFKVTRGDTTVVEVELQPKASSTPAEPVVAKSETPDPAPPDKPAIYSVELDPPQAAFSVEGDGVTVAGTGQQRTVSVAKPQPDKPVMLVARLDGFQDARRKLQPASGASEAIVLKLSPVTKPVPVAPVGNNPAQVAAFKIQLDSDQAIYQRTTLKLGGSLIEVPEALQRSLIAEVDFGDGGATEPVELAPDLTFQLEHVYPTPGEFPVTVVVSDTKTDPVKATATVAVKALTPIPDTAAIDKSRKTIRDIFKKEFADANKTAARIAWSGKLIEQGQQTADDPSGRYVLFDEAALQAVEAPEPNLAFRAIDEMAKTFDINPHAKKAELLTLVVEKTKFASFHKKSAEAGLIAFENALQDDEFVAASDFLKATQKAAEAGKELGLVKKATTASEKLGVAMNELDKFKQAQAKLTTAADDEDANLQVGRFLCFNKRRWSAGLPFLAKSADPTIKRVATLDLSRPTDPDARVLIADEWLKLADGLMPTESRVVVGRATKLYAAVFPDLTGLTRKRVAETLKNHGIFESEPKLLWTCKSEAGKLAIRSATLQGKQVRTLVEYSEFGGEPWRLAINSSTRQILVGTPRFGEINAKVLQFDYNGANRKQLLETGFVWSLTVDEARKVMYVGSAMIVSCNLDGSRLKTFAYKTYYPNGLSVDTKAEKLYWVEAGTSRGRGKLQRSNLDGSQVVDVLRNLFEPVSFALDAESGKMYWTETDPCRVRRANLDGSEMQTLFTGGPRREDGFSDLTLDLKHRKVYFIARDKIRRISFDGGKADNVLDQGGNSIRLLDDSK